MNCVRALGGAIHLTECGAREFMEQGLQSKLREFMKRSFNSWRSQFMEEAQADENSSFLPSFRVDESSNRELRLYREESDFRQQPKSSCFRGAFTYHVFLGTFGARLKHLNQCSYKMEILRVKTERHG